MRSFKVYSRIKNYFRGKKKRFWVDTINIFPAPHSPRKHKLNLRMKSLSLDSPESTEHAQKRRAQASYSAGLSSQSISSKIQCTSPNLFFFYYYYFRLFFYFPFLKEIILYYSTAFLVNECCITFLFIFLPYSPPPQHQH